MPGGVTLVSFSFKIFLTFFCLFILLAIVPGQVSFAETGADGYRLERVVHYPDIADFFLGDIDADGEQEFLRLFSSHRGFQVGRFTRERLLGPALYQGNTAHYIESITFADVDSVPGAELAMTLRDVSGDSLWIEICSGSNPKDILCRTRAVIGKDISDRDNFFSGGWGASASRYYFSDLDGDGNNEIVVPVSVGFDLYPRGIYAYSFPSGELLWSFPLAGNPQKVSIADVNNDGYMEIFFKTWACSNGAVMDGRSDDSSYVFALDYQGRQLWMSRLGDRFDMASHDVLVCDCDADSVWEIYYTQLMRTNDYDRHVMVMEKHRARDNQFIRQHSFDAGERYSELSAVSCDSGALPKLVLNNRPTVLSPRYLTIESRGDLQGDNRLWQVVDIDPENDNGCEYLYTRRDSLYVLSEDLTVRSVFGSKNGETFGHSRFFMTPFGDSFISVIHNIAQGDRHLSQLNIYRLLPEKAKKASLRNNNILLWAGGAILLIIGFLLGYSFRRGGRPENQTDKSQTIQLQELHSHLLTFEHGQMAARNLNRLLFLFSNLPRDPQKLNEIRQNLNSAIDAYSSYTSKQLESIGQVGRKIKSLKSSIYKMTRCNAELTAIFGSIDHGELQKITAGQKLKSILDNLQELNKIVRELKSYLASRLSVDLLKSIPKILIAFSGRLREEGIVLKKVSGAGLLSKYVFFSEAEFSAVMEELLSNACRAMKTAAIKELQLIAIEDKESIIIKIQDTGRGFPRENPSVALERGYSERSESGGFGLYYVRQQVERFGGRIQLTNNADGIGATVILTLKTVAHG